MGEKIWYTFVIKMVKPIVMIFHFQETEDHKHTLLYSRVY